MSENSKKPSTSGTSQDAQPPVDKKYLYNEKDD
jgi:WD40 repeat protein